LRIITANEKIDFTDDDERLELYELFTDNHDQFINYQMDLRDKFFQILSSGLENIYLNGISDRRLPNTANIYFSKCDANRILAKMPTIAASSGAACHADSIEPSQVLRAMGFSDERALGSIRFSFGRTNNINEIETAAENIISVVKELRNELVSQESPKKEKLSLENLSLGCSCKLSPKNLNYVLHKISTGNYSENRLGFENSDDARVYFLNF